MIERYDYINKIDEIRYLEMDEILTKDLIDRRGKKYYREHEQEFKGEGFQRWKDMIRNTKDYNISLYILDNVIAGFVCTMPKDNSLFICEIQIRKEYQHKYGILKILLREVVNQAKKYNKDIISGTISNNNQHSKDVFTHIGMNLIDNIWYEGLLSKFEKYANKENRKAK